MAITDLTGTTWRFLEVLPSGNTSKTFNFDFISNDSEFTKLEVINTFFIVYYFTTPSTGSEQVYNYMGGSSKWIMGQVYRTITITGGQDVTDPDCIAALYRVAELIREECVVTYRINNGQWEDGTREPKTEVVYEGDSPVEIPENMVGDAGYDIGGWEPDPYNTVVMTNMAFEYTFRKSRYDVIYRVSNGTWSDGSIVPRTETVMAGNRPQNIPSGMLPYPGYEGGEWDRSPDIVITSDDIFTYIFTRIPPPITDENYFVFGDESSLDFGLYIGGQFSFNAPGRDVTKVSIPGRNGDLIQDNGRFHNVQIAYPIVVMQNFRNKTDEIKAWLLSKKGYVKLTDKHHPDTFRMARVAGGIDFTTSAYNHTGKTKVIFDCKPQRFLTSGEELVDVNGSIENPTQFESNPFIHIEGSGAGTLTINNTLISLYDIDGYVDIDCERKLIYKGVASKAHTVFLPNYLFPTLLPGENVVAYSGGVTKVQMKGNWWII